MASLSEQANLPLPTISLCTTNRVSVRHVFLYVCACSITVSMRSMRSMRGGLSYAVYAFYAWWAYFPQSGALAEGTSRPESRKHALCPSLYFPCLSCLFFAHTTVRLCFFLCTAPFDTLYSLVIASSLLFKKLLISLRDELQTRGPCLSVTRSHVYAKLDWRSVISHRGSSS